jgi:hypothetical protein
VQEGSTPLREVRRLERLDGSISSAGSSREVALPGDLGDAPDDLDSGPVDG